MYIRRRPRVRVEPLQSGGGQERGMRSGTVPTPLVVGLGEACEISQKEMEVIHYYQYNFSLICVYFYWMHVHTFFGTKGRYRSVA